MNVELFYIAAGHALPAIAAGASSTNKTIGETKVRVVNNEWLDAWIDRMKPSLAPSTIKKRVELFARCIDWAMRKNFVALSENPMRLLPVGYASDGKQRARDRRLSEDGTEEGAIRKVLVEKKSTFCLIWPWSRPCGYGRCIH